MLEETNLRCGRVNVLHINCCIYNLAQTAKEAMHYMLSEDALAMFKGKAHISVVCRKEDFRSNSRKE